jgi:hypothetical protein
MTEDEYRVAAMLQGQPVIVTSDGCWLLDTAPHDGSGYRTLSVPGDRQRLAHRVVARFTHGALLAPIVRHLCNRPQCLRPIHVRPGTMRDNAADRDRAGKTARNERHGKAKLTPETVVALRRDRDAGLSYRALGRKYGVSNASARAVALGIHWRAA